MFIYSYLSSQNTRESEKAMEKKKGSLTTPSKYRLFCYPSHTAYFLKLCRLSKDDIEASISILSLVLHSQFKLSLDRRIYEFIFLDPIFIYWWRIIELKKVASYLFSIYFLGFCFNLTGLF